MICGLDNQKSELLNQLSNYLPKEEIEALDLSGTFVEVLPPKKNSNHKSHHEILGFRLSSIFTGLSSNSLYDTDIYPEQDITKSVLYRTLCNDYIDQDELLLKTAINFISQNFDYSKEWHFIVDDTLIERPYSRFAEGIIAVYEHNKRYYVLGYFDVTLCLTDGTHTIPLMHRLATTSDVSNNKKYIPQKLVRIIIDDRYGKEIRTALTKKKSELVTDMIQKCSERIETATHKCINNLICDSWYADNGEFRGNVNHLGCNVIGFLKINSTRYQLPDDSIISMKDLIRKAHTSMQINNKHNRSDIVARYTVKRFTGKLNANNVPSFLDNPEDTLTVVIVKNISKGKPNKQKGLLPLLTTEGHLSSPELVCTYRKRWNIEVIYGHLKRGDAFQLNLGKDSSRNLTAICMNLTLHYIAYMLGLVKSIRSSLGIHKSITIFSHIVFEN